MAQVNVDRLQLSVVLQAQKIKPMSWMEEMVPEMVPEMSLRKEKRPRRLKWYDLSDAQLIYMYQIEGDRRALDALCYKHRYFVAHYLNKKCNVSRYNRIWKDLYQSAFLGFVIAVSRYDSDKGASLINYASYYIRNEVYKCVNRSGAINTPENISGLKRITAFNYYQVGQKVQRSRIHSRTRILDQDIRTALRDSRVRLRRAFQVLEPRDRYIVWMTNATKEVQYPTLGLFFGLTAERVRQIKDESISKLRKHLRVLDLSPYLEYAEEDSTWYLQNILGLSVDETAGHCLIPTKRGDEKIVAMLPLDWSKEKEISWKDHHVRSSTPKKGKKRKRVNHWNRTEWQLCHKYGVTYKKKILTEKKGKRIEAGTV
jgi:RNA polymerase sigma factor (sigma-70 family)